jgi:hypothetical protein
VSPLRFVIVLGSPIALAGCAEDPLRPEKASESRSPEPVQVEKQSKALVPAKLLRLNHGYTLLYELMGKQSDVDKILILRDASEPTQAVIHEIAAACTNAKKQLEVFAKGDPQLHMDLKDLPEAEVDTRAAIQSATTKKLLLGSGFELKLILTQVSATEYGAFLARTLADLDPDKVRVAWLKELEKNLQDLYQKVVGRLAVRS